MFFAIPALMLSTLALLSQGWVLDGSCWDSYPRESRDNIRDAMEESEKMGISAENDITGRRDRYDNTKSRMFYNAEATHLQEARGMYSATQAHFDLN
jgi:TRAP-type C4-dicarboxylate transport system substrate-binding protein